MRKFIYLISPNNIHKNFYKELDLVLSANNVKFFQLRLKKQKIDRVIKIAKKIKKITSKHNVKLIINDSVKITNAVLADGCHLGQKDIFNLIKKSKNMKLSNVKNEKIRSFFAPSKQKKLIGITCHNSKHLAKIALKNKADYIAFGSFNNSKLKPEAKKANFNILRWAKKNVKKPIVAIGGIDNLNYKKLINLGANYIAISSYIWDNPKLKPEIAIKRFK